MKVSRLQHICDRITTKTLELKLGNFLAPVKLRLRPGGSLRAGKTRELKESLNIAMLSRHTGIPKEELITFRDNATPKMIKQIEDAVKLAAKQRAFYIANTTLGGKLEQYAEPKMSALGRRGRIRAYFILAHLPDENLEFAFKLTDIPMAVLREYREFRKTEIPRMLNELFTEKPNLAPSKKEILQGNVWGSKQTVLSAKMSAWEKETGINFHILRAFWDETPPEERQVLFN